MGARDAARVQLDFPQLVADIIRQLNLTGTVGLLEFSDQVTPVYIVAQRAGALDIDLTPVAFASAEIASGIIINPGAGVVIADTGPLAAGNYDIFGNISTHGNQNISGNAITIEHRDAADAATLATLLYNVSTTVSGRAQAFLPPIGYILALNERLRVVSKAAYTGVVGGMIGARLRPTP